MKSKAIYGLFLLNFVVGADFSPQRKNHVAADFSPQKKTTTD